MSNLYVTTTQNVKLFFTPASVGERILAYGVDLIIKAAYAIIVYYLFFVISDMKNMRQHDEDVMILVITIISSPLVFYTLVCESLMNGQTFGKKLLKIKVIKIDGFQAGFFEYLTRWFFLIIDVHFGYFIGLTTMLVAKHSQRLGDLAAGTAVISEKSKYDISHTILMDVEEEYKPYFTQNQILLFSDNDMRIIKENAEIAIKLNNITLLKRLALKVETVMNIQNPFFNEQLLLEIVQKDFNYYTGK